VEEFCRINNIPLISDIEKLDPIRYCSATEVHSFRSNDLHENNELNDKNHNSFSHNSCGVGRAQLRAAMRERRPGTDTGVSIEPNKGTIRRIIVPETQSEDTEWYVNDWRIDNKEDKNKFKVKLNKQILILKFILLIKYLLQ
jgi:hypothetical protein